MGGPLDYLKRIYYLCGMEQFTTFLYIIGAIIFSVAVISIFNSDDDHHHYDN